MKSTTALSLITVLVLGVACSKDSKSKKSDLQPAAPEAPVTASHKAEECPLINGEFSLEGNEKITVVIHSEVQENGLNFEVADVSSVIDGQTHKLGEDSDISYSGNCEAGKVVLSWFESDKKLSQVSYSLNEKGQLVVASQVEDTTLGESDTQVWSPKTESTEVAQK